MGISQTIDPLSESYRRVTQKFAREMVTEQTKNSKTKAIFKKSKDVLADLDGMKDDDADKAIEDDALDLKGPIDNDTSTDIESDALREKT